MQSSGLWIMDITGSDWSNEEDPLHLSFIFFGNQNHKKLPLQVTGKEIQIKVLQSLSIGKKKNKSKNHVPDNALHSDMINCFFN